MWKLVNSNIFTWPGVNSLTSRIWVPQLNFIKKLYTIYYENITRFIGLYFLIIHNYISVILYNREKFTGFILKSLVSKFWSVRVIFLALKIFFYVKPMLIANHQPVVVDAPINSNLSEAFKHGICLYACW